MTLLWQAHTVPGDAYTGPLDDVKAPRSWRAPSLPPGYRPAGPWEPVAPFPGMGVLWRRPLKGAP